MSLFNHVEFDHHEQVCYVSDAQSGLKAIIAIHDSRLGPALGGTRMYPYTSDEEALTDVLRLSRGMTYKSAMARLPLGGGKSVIIGDPRSQKTPELLRAFGRYLERLGGAYIAAEDSGTSVPDMKIIAEETRNVTGFHDKQTTDGKTRSGDPSPATALGCFLGIKAAVKHQLQRDDLSNLTVGMQGLGNVGFRVAEMLHDAGAKLVVTDVNDQVLMRAKSELGAHVVELNDIYRQPMDVFSPCALGATINPGSLAELKASIIAGAANNQLDTPETGQLLHSKGICYAPDYVINAGGIIDVCYEQLGAYDSQQVNHHIEGIYDTLMELFERSRRDDLATSKLADTVARERLSLGETVEALRKTA